MEAPIPAYYNPNKPTILQTDTSCKGLGACLLQNEKPVYFASKALTEMQKGYVVIELESLVVAWAMEKFNHFNCVWILYNRTDFYLLLDKLSQPNMAASSGLSGKMFFPATLEF